MKKFGTERENFKLYQHILKKKQKSLEKTTNTKGAKNESFHNMRARCTNFMKFTICIVCVGPKNHDMLFKQFKT